MYSLKIKRLKRDLINMHKSLTGFDKLDIARMVLVSEGEGVLEPKIIVLGYRQRHFRQIRRNVFIWKNEFSARRVDGEQVN